MNIKLSLTSKLSDYLQDSRGDKSLAAYIHEILINHMLLNTTTVPTDKEKNGKTKRI